MIDPRILKFKGATLDRLREIFTAKSVDPNDTTLTTEAKAQREKDVETRQYWERRISSQLLESANFSLANASIYQAVDLAWDSPPITKETFALMQFAQGKLNTQECISALSGLCNGDHYITKNDKGQSVGIDLPKFVDFNVNLIRSFVTRRLAAQEMKYGNLFPFYKYESRSTSQVGKLMADAWSQRADIMADQFDYRHSDTQITRDMFLFAHGVSFLKSAWERDSQWQVKEAPAGLNPTNTITNDDIDEVIEREGVDFVRAHPTRIFCDSSASLNTINSDLGAEWYGYWDIVPYGTIKRNMDLWNTDRIGFSTGFIDLLTTYTSYFNQYYTQITVPDLSRKSGDAAAAAGNNDLRATSGRYAEQEDGASIMQAYYFAKLIPKDHGMGDYPYPVWVRFIWAGDCVVHAEFLPSRAGLYCGLNENDARRVNLSFAMELIPFQDAMTNLTTHLMAVLRQEQLKIIGINTDIITKKEDRDKFENQITGDSWYCVPIIIPYSGTQLSTLGLDKPPFFIAQPNINPQSIQSIFQAMTSLVQLVERLEAMSPNESGQPIVRGNGGVTATEANNIEQTTTAVYAFVSSAIDEYRAAKKRIIFENSMAFMTDEFVVPVINRYPPSVVAAAGFKLWNETPDMPDEPQQLQVSKRVFLKHAHDFIFTTRDGSERESNVQTATTLIQLFPLLTNPLILPSLKKSKVFELINEIVRRSGAGLDLNIEVKPGEEEWQGDQTQQQIDQLTQIVSKLVPAVEGIMKDIGQFKALLAGRMSGGANQPPQ